MLTVGGLGAWLTGYRIVIGIWPDHTVTTPDTIDSIAPGSVAVLAAVGVAVACTLAMILAALWSGLSKRVTLLSNTVPGQTAMRCRDLATLMRNQVEQIGGVYFVTVTTRRSRVDVVVPSVLDDLKPVQEAARKTTDEALETFQPTGITRSRVWIKRTN